MAKLGRARSNAVTTRTSMGPAEASKLSQTSTATTSKSVQAASTASKLAKFAGVALSVVSIGVLDLFLLFCSWFACSLFLFFLFCLLLFPCSLVVFCDWALVIKNKTKFRYRSFKYIGKPLQNFLLKWFTHQEKLLRVGVSPWKYTSFMVSQIFLFAHKDTIAWKNY